MATIFDVFFEYKIAGVLPLWVPVGIGVIGFIIWLIFTRRPHQKEFKELDMRKEIKKDFDTQYNYFGVHVGKPIASGLIKLGWVLGYMPMTWNKRYKKFTAVKGKFDPKRMEDAAMGIYSKPFKELDDAQKQGVRETVKEETQGGGVEIVMEGEKPKFKFGKLEESGDLLVPVSCFRVCKDSFFSKLLADAFGAGIRYFLMDNALIKDNDGSIQLQEGLQRQVFFNNFIFSKAGKDIIENTSFKINRQSEIQEIGNDVARTIFWDNEFRKRALIERERAEIESRKFASQKEGQQD